MNVFLNVCCALVVLAGCSASAATIETPAQREARMAWWREARFGMFIHYGPVALTGKEISWSRANSNTNCPNKGPTPITVYDNLYKEFNPTNFNAADWTGVAKMAGMKYVVLTAKHCDGFLLWDSKVDAYDIMNTPFQRDLCADLADGAGVRHHGCGVEAGIIGYGFQGVIWYQDESNADHASEYARLFPSAGACGYVLQRSRPEEILDTIAQLRSGGAPIAFEIARMVGRSFRDAKPNAGENDSLTPREMEILVWLADGLSSKEFGVRLHSGVGTVRTHVTRHLREAACAVSLRGGGALFSRIGRGQ